MDQYKASKEEVFLFLKELRELIDAPDFDINKNFSWGVKPERKKNKDTLFALRMDILSVLQELKKLTISTYYQSLPDDKNPNMPDFHVFFISNLSDKEIYVKVRIQKVRKIMCISFHFAEYSHGKFPYAKG